MAIKPRILTEDNPENRLPVQRILMAEGFELLTADKLRSYSFTTPKGEAFALGVEKAERS